MKKHIRERVLRGANYMIENKCTIEEVARELNISQSTAQVDLRERLENVDASLKRVVDEIVDSNITSGKIKGGLTMATRRKLEAEKVNRSIEEKTYGQKIHEIKYSMDRVKLDDEEMHMIHGILELSKARESFNVDYNNRIESIIKNKKRSGCFE